MKKNSCILSAIWERIKGFFNSPSTTSPAQGEGPLVGVSPLNENTVLDKLYDNRKEFSIIAMTGPIGCGIGEFCDILSKPLAAYQNQVRRPDQVTVDPYNEEEYKNEIPHDIIKQTVFKRKYTICYNYWSQHQCTYSVLKYNKMSLLYMLVWLSRREGTIKENFRDKIRECLIKIINETNYSKTYLGSNKENKLSNLFSVIINNIDVRFGDLFDELSTINEDITKPFLLNNAKRQLSDYFVNNNIFANFYNKFCDELSKEDFFLYCFLWHHLGYNIRTTGSPYKSESDNAQEHIFDIIELLNIVIKNASDKKNRRFVINAIRNSLEIRYLAGRYNAFYLISTHKSLKTKEAIEKLVDSRNGRWDSTQRDNLVKHLTELSLTEGHEKDFKNGKIASPNVEQCVAQAEIHIHIQSLKRGEQVSEFYSTAEQWIKYASLMLHPGLITPSSEERCMEIAYTAKFNSGCVSRQVGAVITNKEHAIRAIGWNEVPYGQVSCGLRSLSDVVRGDFSDYKQHMYSDFERGDADQANYKDHKSFKEKVADDYKSILPQMEAKLQSCPSIYCFRELHNKYTGERNQVYGRSLHAEENALMQIAKDGGEGLKDGLIYVTASPCELCSRKLYQVGVRKIIYIDPYPGIAREQTIASGYKKPKLEQYKGAYGATYYKLFTPLISPKDEQSIRCIGVPSGLIQREDVLKEVQNFLKKQNIPIDITKSLFTQTEKEQLKRYLETLRAHLNEPQSLIVRRTIIKMLVILKK